MKSRRAQLRAVVSPGDVEEILAKRYEKLSQWGKLLACGDTGVAQDIVHDLCLYLMLTRPNFGEVANLDGYLYTSLRHVYLSRMERLARETLRFVSVSDFDSFGFAMASIDRSGSVDIQNDLREICSYAVWRKDSLKGFSYFILHFFHGYFPREIAEIACLPVAAIYNKLKVSRTELRAHLAGPDKLHSINQVTRPAPTLSLQTVSSSALFLELRKAILQARMPPCLTEDELLAHYRTPLNSPIPCALLSHIVSCERCLALIDRHFGRPTLKDRDALDGFDRAQNLKDFKNERAELVNVEMMLRSMRRRRDRIYHHRPGTLSISINGRIIAFHDVHGLQSRLAARIEHTEDVHFVEVFSEQHIRLALLSIGDAPPDGPHTIGHQTSLSDERWLKLNLVFDGLGLQTAVTYFDMALAPDAQAEDEEHLEVTRAPLLPQTPSALGHQQELEPSSFAARVLRFLRPLPVFAWGLAVASVVCAGGYLAYRHSPGSLDANTILNRSINAEMASLEGNTAHEIIDLQETSSSGRILHGVVDLWKDGNDNRLIRRLYDARHNLIATQWQENDGRSITSVLSNNTAIAETDRELATNDLWKQDVSPRTFRSIAGHGFKSAFTKDGYELSTSTPAENTLHLISAVLVINHGFTPVSETLRIQTGGGIQEVRLVLTKRERQPSSTVPDRVFSPGKMDAKAIERYGSGIDAETRVAGTELQLVQLQIAALYELNQMGADVGEPIEVERTSDGRIRIYGAMSDEGRRAQFISRLKTLSDRQLLLIQLRSSNRVQAPPLGRSSLIVPSMSIYNVSHSEAPADGVMARHFIAKGWPVDRARTASIQFSQEALEHARRAHQHAYALDRLGTSFSKADLHSVNENVQREWAEMAAGHAGSLEHELRALQNQLKEVTSSAGEQSAIKESRSTIQTVSSFTRAADRLLQETQGLNRIVGATFASTPARSKNITEESSALLSDVEKAIPLQEAVEMVSFTARLSAAEGVKAGQDSSTIRRLHDPKR
jgi:DNA-directed RNA polymerase specialized sigma24 family protein